MSEILRWKLTNAEYEYIKEVVVDIFIRYNIRFIPVSGFEIATKMGITVVQYSSLTEKKLQSALEVSDDGFYREECGREYIYINDIDKSYERQNMTILHEIGHCVLDHTGEPENFDHEENEAKFFAKYAIAPPPLVHKIHPEDYIDIYFHFDISISAARYAYDYYQTWLKRRKRVGRFEKYERDLLSLYRRNTAKKKGCDAYENVI